MYSVEKELWNMLWWVVLYIGGLAAFVIALRIVFVPPKGSGGQTEKSPFQLWVEFSRERLKQEIEADLEKYRIDKGLAHRRWEEPPA